MIGTGRRLLIGTGLAGALVSLGISHSIRSEFKELEIALRANVAKPLLEVEGQELSVFPWEQSYKDFSLPDNWEFRKIKIRGELSKTTHLVYRERNGEKGYLVFKALYTARSTPAGHYKAKSLSEIENVTGTLVNIGWVPDSKLKEVGFADVDYIKKYEPNEEDPFFLAQISDPFTGATYNAVTEEEVEFPKEGFESNEVIVTGYLRKGEKENILLGHRNWKKENLNALVDLEKMSAFYGMDNIASASDYYLEVALPKSLKKVKENNIVIPSTFRESSEEIDEYLRSSTKPASLYTKAGLLSCVAAITGMLI